ncbi:MAG: hypothetical protein CL534_23350 [Ahrensia sp.]|nr:hypothetical protein [Ahrensia sp.]
MKILTEEEAFEAMRRFLDLQWQRAPDLEVASVLGDISLETTNDGGTADPAAADEWHDCVLQVLNNSRKH